MSSLPGGSMSIIQTTARDARVAWIQPERRDHRNRRQFPGQRIADAPRALAVHDLNSIGTPTERQVDFLDDPCDGFLDSQSMEIDPAGRCAFVRATPRRHGLRLGLLRASTFFGRCGEVIFPA